MSQPSSGRFSPPSLFFPDIQLHSSRKQFGMASGSPRWGLIRRNICQALAAARRERVFVQNGEIKGGASAPGALSPGRSRGILLDPVGCSSWTWCSKNLPGWKNPPHPGSNSWHCLPSLCQLLPRSFLPFPNPSKCQGEEEDSFSTSALPGGGVTEREQAEEETSE